MEGALVCPVCREEQPPQSAGRGQVQCCWKCGAALEPDSSGTRAGSLALASTHKSEQAGAPQQPPPLPSPPPPTVPKGDTWARGRVILDDYQIEGKLGAGGMGVVYLVRSQASGRHFAVKRTHIHGPEQRRAFLDELQTWIRLPEHPHLAACRFFRTVQDEIVLFTDFVEGGSLAQWIERRQLLRVEQVLDVAIQLAWGLHAVHEQGIIHQDVKPGNVLLTREGLVRVTDFGLARARAAAGQADAAGEHSMLVSAGGMTPAYCSPEQAAGRPLRRTTDVWSWGLSVLEMFTGGVLWRSGTEAAQALEALLSRGPDPHLPALPPEVAAVLARCFQSQPSERWPTLLQAADALRAAYRQVTGREHERPAPPFPSPDVSGPAHDRESVDGACWDDPRVWLGVALRVERRPDDEVDALLPPRTGSRKAQALADLAAFDEVRRRFERLIAGGRKDLQKGLAMVCGQAALVHKAVDDMPGALELYDRAIVLYGRLIKEEGRNDLIPSMAGIVMNKAFLVNHQGKPRVALEQYDLAIAILEQGGPQLGPLERARFLAHVWNNKSGIHYDLQEYRTAADLAEQAIALNRSLLGEADQQEVRTSLALACVSKGNALRGLGDHRAAVAALNEAITLYERLVNEGRPDLANKLAMAYSNTAIAVQHLGDLAAALGLFDRAIARLDQLINQEGRYELVEKLALAYVNRAGTLVLQGDLRGAAAQSDQAIALYERLVHGEGRRELAEDLVRAYRNKGVALRNQGDFRGATAVYDRAIALLERLVHGEGRQELILGLVQLYMLKATSIRRGQGDAWGAVALYDRAVEVCRKLGPKQRREAAGDGAWVVANRAAVLLDLGKRERAASDARTAVPILRAEASRTGRADLHDVLDWALRVFRDLLE